MASAGSPTLAIMWNRAVGVIPSLLEHLYLVTFDPDQPVIDDGALHMEEHLRRGSKRCLMSYERPHRLDDALFVFAYQPRSGRNVWRPAAGLSDDLHRAGAISLSMCDLCAAPGSPDTWLNYSIMPSHPRA